MYFIFKFEKGAALEYMVLRGNAFWTMPWELSRTQDTVGSNYSPDDER